MKKSDAIKLVMDTFELEGLGTRMREKDAASIIDALIEVGMLPPPYTYIPGNPETPSFIGSAMKHAWEPENA